MKTTPAAVSLVCIASLVAARNFTVTNNCAYTIWPALYTDLNVGTATPSQPTGWEQAAAATVSFAVPDNWTSGRIWGRRNCDFTTNPGPNSCLDGGCNGGLLCDPKTGTGVPPATLAEFTLSTSSGVDYYDVSLVDGFNIPISITFTTASYCSIASCPVDLNANCPAALKGPLDSNGVAVGCKSDCTVDPNPSDSPSCCSGTHATPATCPPSGVPNYNYFKQNCPNSYVYAYDESSGTALQTCPSTTSADYTITFCPTA
ncbi:hypothetical protein FRB95_004767 [Tulasnella sp. JGI-2019a]|nr:hypothetical protein FRB93_000512 [Tulasnella sp. JGI-2019a]KAG9029891.1 hypothetical protein FRB95_004767 [Tulasnella sp. JGI-2019a]